jgi:hypothetical protein
MPLQAVHSGADVQSAAATVMGYRQAAVKGKAILVDPVPIAATDKLKGLLQACLLAQAQQVCVQAYASQASFRPVRSLLDGQVSIALDPELSQ